MILLDKVFRQQNDTVFLGILNDLRMGVVTPQAQRVLAGKVQESYRKEREANLLKESSTGSGSGGGSGGGAAEGTGSAPTGSTVPAASGGAGFRKGFAIPKAAAPVVAVRPTKLFSTNKDVDAYNNIELQKLADADAFGDCYRYAEHSSIFVVVLSSGTHRNSVNVHSRIGIYGCVSLLRRFDRQV